MLSCDQLCDPMDCTLPGSSVHGVSQARILEWVPFPSPGGLADPGIEPHLLHLLHWQVDSSPQCHLGSLPPPTPLPNPVVNKLSWSQKKKKKGLLTSTSFLFHDSFFDCPLLRPRLYRVRSLSKIQRQCDRKLKCSDRQLQISSQPRASNN